MGGYKAYWKKKKAAAAMLPKEKFLVKLDVHLDAKTYEYLTKLKEGPDGLPLSRYVQIAIDNEMDQEKPFHYALKFPDEPYLEDKYAHEANLIFDFMRKYSYKGISLMMLMLLRRVVGISDRERVYRGYVELLNTGLVEENYPKDEKFVFPKWYRKIKVKPRITE